jgi:putative toxin-antitoxin system antitoxin component (TIGR02293 family)
MPEPVEQVEIPESEAAEIERVARLLGGRRVLRQRLARQFDVHEILAQGLPSAALTHLVEHMVIIEGRDFFERALGMSLRTYQRAKTAPRRPLSKEQSGRTWKFAEVLAKATEVFGSREEAEAWLERPAIGLEQRRPIDLLETPAGVKLVEDHLGRLEYGVYT